MDSREWKGKSRGGKQGNLFFVLLLRYAGINAAYLFLTTIIPYFVIFAPKATQAIWDFYRRRLQYGILHSAISIPLHFYKFGQVLIDKTAIGMGLQERYKFKFINQDLFEKANLSTKGMMTIGAHIGSWESGAPFFSTFDRRANIVMLDAEHKSIKEIFEESRKETPYNIIPLEEDMVSTIINIKCALGRNEMVCTQGDRFMASKKDGTNHTCRLDFLGSPALFPQGPFMLAKKFKVPVLFFFALRTGKKEYTLNFYEPKSDMTIEESYVNELERLVREYPQQWFNFYKFW